MSTSTDGGPDLGRRRSTRPTPPAGSAASRVVQPNGTVVVPIEQRERDRDPRVPLHQRRRELGQRRHRRDGRRATTWPAACAAGRCRPPRSTAPARSTSCGRTAASAAAAPPNDIVMTHLHRRHSPGRRWSASRSTPTSEHGRPLHPRHRRRPVDARAPAPGSRWPTTTTRTPNCTTRDLPTRRGLRLLGRRRQHVDEPRPARRADDPDLAGQHQPGLHGGRLHLDVVRRRQRAPASSPRQPPSGGVFDEAIFTSGTAAAAQEAAGASRAARGAPVLTGSSDHAAPAAPVRRR